MRTYRNELATAGEGKDKLVKAAPGAWNQASKRWRWSERAEAWDMHDQAEKRAAYEEAKREEREFRLLIIRSLRKHLTEALLAYTAGTEDMSLSQLAYVCRVVLQEIRQEFDEPVPGVTRITAIESGGPVRVVQADLDKNPNDMSDQEIVEAMSVVLAEGQ